MMLKQLTQLKNAFNIKQIYQFRNLTGKSVLPQMPQRPAIPASENRVQEYKHLTAKEYKMIFQNYDGKDEKERMTAYFCLEHKGKVYHVFDASKMPFGKIIHPSVEFLQGKHRPTYRKNIINKDDVVIITNASQLMLRGKKKLYKEITYHTGYIGNLKKIPYKKFIQEKPEQLFFWNIRRSLPKVKQRDEDYQHEFGEFLPNFLPRLEKVDKTFDKDMFQEMMDDEPKIIYKSADQVPSELQGLQYEEDESILEFNKKKQYVKFNMNKQQIIKLQKEYKRKLKRYRTYEYKQPRNRDPKLHNESFMVTSDHQVQKQKLQDYVVQSDQEDEDD